MSLVCWSGGLDSTLVLHRLAVEQRDGTAHHPHGVRALTILHPQTSMHEVAAAKARKAIAARFLKLGLTISYLEVAIKQSAVAWRIERFVGSSTNPQALLWLTTAVNYLEYDEDFYTGYIRGDDYWHGANRYQAAFDCLQSIAGHTGAMRHPLEWDSKAEVIRRTKELKLHDLCWWCEEMELKPVRGKARACGTCKSCETHAAGQWICSRDPPPEIVKARKRP